MPAGMTIPAMQMQQPAIGGVNGGVSGYGPPPPPSSSSSGLLLGQHSSMSMNMGKNHMNMNLMEGHHHIHELHPLEMPGGGPGHQSPSEGDLGLIRDEEYESRSGGSDNHDQDPSGEDEQDPNQTLPVGAKRKRYHRHTQHQIQEMENFFKRNPHPDDKQRKILGFELGLEPLQVKFWFQNKRTQMKTHQERSENTVLRAENEKLRVENIRYREAISAISCPNCGGPSVEGDLSFDEQQLRVENNHLREEIDRISTIAARYVGRPLTSYAVTSPRPLEFGFGNPSNIGDDMIIRPRDADKPIIIDLAVAAMDEVMRMAHMEAPLWVPAGVNDGGTTIVLNMDEYMRTFPRGIGPRPDGFRYEASREAAIVIMNHIDLVEVFMDVYKWSTVFAGIISRASTLDVLSTGVAGNYNGALQVMSAEIQVPTPVVSTREIYFVRYCKQQGEGTWVIADVSIDGLHPSQVSRCRRRPSGCIIQEMPNGYSKVTWVDHVEVEDRGIHDIYKAVVHSGLAFGAKRWISTLDRQCERIARAMATNIHPNDVFNIAITNPDGRRSMLKLAERMVLSFCQGVSASTAHTWTTLSGSGADDVRVMTRKSIDDPGRPPGIVLCAATSFWLPVPPKPVFDFVRDENSRNEWDILSSGGMVQEIAHIAYGHETGNCISLLRVNSNNSTQTNMLIIEESFTDPTGSYVIYAPVDTMAMNVVLGGGNPDYVALLPSGFAIMPDGTSAENADHGSSGGSLMTVAFQILVDSVPSAKLSLGSVATVNNLITMTVDRIKASLAGDIS